MLNYVCGKGEVLVTTNNLAELLDWAKLGSVIERCTRVVGQELFKVALRFLQTFRIVVKRCFCSVESKVWLGRRRRWRVCYLLE